MEKTKSDCFHYSNTVLVARKAMKNKDWPAVRSALALYNSFPPLGGKTIEDEMEAIQEMQTIEHYAKHFKHRCRGGVQLDPPGKIINFVHPASVTRSFARAC